MKDVLTLLIDGHDLSDERINSIINNIDGTKHIYFDRETDSNRQYNIQLNSDMGRVEVHSVYRENTVDAQQVISLNIAHRLGVLCETLATTKFLVVSSDPAFKFLVHSMAESFCTVMTIDLKEGSEAEEFIRYLGSLEVKEVSFQSILKRYNLDFISSIVPKLCLMGVVKQGLVKGSIGMKWETEVMRNLL